MHPARGSKMATETATAGWLSDGRRTNARRGRAVRVLCSVALTGALVASAVALASHGVAKPAGSPAPPPAAALRATSHNPASPAPALFAKRPKRQRHSGRASIGLFTATPATLPASGGTVHLVAVVQSATTCRFTVSKTVGHLPAAKTCTSGSVSVELRVPRNSGASAQTYYFGLLAKGTAGTTSAQPVKVVERAVATPGAAPSIAVQPVSDTVGAGVGVTFQAAAKGPASVQWQVSSNGGQTWSDIAGAKSTSYSFVATGAENGYKYRAVFSSGQRTSATDAATLTVTAAGTASNTQPPAGQSATTTAGPPDAAPVITVQPVATGAVAGGSATYTAQASGSPAPTVQWQVSVDGINWSDIPGATSTTYSFTASLGDNPNEYHAVFTNRAGTATTNNVLINVQAYVIPPTVTTQPLSQDVLAGTLVTFTAGSSGGVPPPSVQWQYSTDSGITWNNIGGANATSYSFTATDVENGWEFRAKFVNTTDGSNASLTGAATLTVSPPVKPAITVNPFPQSVFLGAQASFSAAASGSPQPTAQWEVSTNGGSTFSPIAGATSTTYTFTPSGGQSGEEFEAVFTNAAGSATTAPALLTVSVPQAGPTVTTEPASQAIANGANASFVAAASGSPAPSVQWQVSPDQGSTWGDVSGATSATYSFSVTASESGWEFRAKFVNASGTAYTNAATLTVGSDQGTTNWSGYAASGSNGTFTSVSGSWTVPSSSCPSSSSTYSSEWIGIDGYTSATVQQDGTDSDCNGTTPVYYAWYEMFPATNVQIPHPVSAGDSMSATVSVVGSNWTLQIADGSPAHPWSFSTTIPGSGVAQSSAEWIVERPGICSPLCQPGYDTLLTDFGTTGFSNASANGQPISNFSNVPLQMTDQNATVVLALPGALNFAGNGFNERWYGSS